jgi:hypothetical protein
MRNDEALAVLDAEAAEDAFDPHRNAPQPSPECLYGLVGDIGRAGSATTEANPYAIAANALAYIGCAIGRGPYLPIGDTFHHACLFTLHVGRSGEARKGDATSLIKRIAHRVGEMDKHLAPQIHTGGLSSREGLAFLIHDGYRDGKEEVPPIADKRLYIVESEFANVLAQGKRDGNTLSSALRDCWDGVSLRPATKGNRMWASDPHVCLSAAITPSELLQAVAARDLTNGFMNRFMVTWAERTKRIPFPSPTSPERVNELAQRIQKVLEIAKAERWVDRDHTRMQMTDEARQIWRKLYMDALNSRNHGERINALIERRAPMLLRMAMIFALCDLTHVIDVRHINAAAAWVRYSVDSVKFIFNSAADEAAAEATDEDAAKIIMFLHEHEHASRTNISLGCFQNHASKARIDAALDELLTASPPRVLIEEDRTGSGRPTKFYRLAAKQAKQAKNEAACGFAPDSDPCEESEISEKTPAASSELLSQNSILSTPPNRLESRADRLSSLISLISLSSQGDADDEAGVLL